MSKHTARDTVKGIKSEDARNTGRLCPDKEHDSRGEGKDNEGVDGPDLLGSDEGYDTPDDGASVTDCEPSIIQLSYMKSPEDAHA